ncbi:MAG: stage 0 sporulation family protein [Clostridia bacterium]|nr:stage 0 sporulation family protein [Clostridia bacterium]
MVPEVIVSIEDDDTPKVHVTGVRFKPGGKVYFFAKGDLEPKSASYVIVETARGLEFGEVAFGDREVKESALVPPLRPVVRIATDEDIQRNKENKKKEDEAFKICAEKIQKHGLSMKLLEAQYSFDNSKLLFYFTSANRVDFRELVKDLASVFKTRIELRQIGIRDEAKIMGGLGVCGRPLCCSTFLSDFVQVSIKMAKEQNLSLNSGKISGCCGRLMCCLQYEYSTYVEETAKTPPVDSTVKTKDGIGIVTEVAPLAATLKVRLKDKPDSSPVVYKRDDVTLIAKPTAKKAED